MQPDVNVQGSRRSSRLEVSRDEQVWHALVGQIVGISQKKVT